MGKKKLQRRIAQLERERDIAQHQVDILLSRDNRTDTKEVIKSLLDGITPLIIGYQNQNSDQRTRVQEIITAMGSQGLDEKAGVGEGQWFPDVEFDMSMEAPSRWPTANTISQPTKPGVNTLNGSYRIENGQAVRNDGAPMFQAGQTAPPPESGIE